MRLNNQQPANFKRQGHMQQEYVDQKENANPNIAHPRFERQSLFPSQYQMQELSMSCSDTPTGYDMTMRKVVADCTNFNLHLKHQNGGPPLQSMIKFDNGLN